MGRGTRWLVGMLALALWVAAPYVAGQQTKRGAHHGKRALHQGTTHAHSGAGEGTPHVPNPGLSPYREMGTASSVPEAGTPTLENPRPTGTLDTMPNQTLTPGATTVPSNAGGIAPASNAASSGEDTPSEGRTAPNTPGANPSNTQGVPTFSSAAQPPDANLPRTVAPRRVTGQPSQGSQKPH